MENVRSIVSDLAALGALLSMVAAAIAVPAALVVVWRRSRAWQVVVPPIEDATADADVHAVLAGITHDLREAVAEALPGVTKHALHCLELAQQGEGVVEHNATRALADQVRGQVRLRIESTWSDLEVEDMVPERIRGPVHLLRTTLLKSRQVCVSGVLQRRSDGPGCLGVSFDVKATGALDVDRRFTIWERCTVGSAGAPAPLRIERVHALMGRVADIVACEALFHTLICTPPPRREGSGGRHQRVKSWQANVHAVMGDVYLKLAQGSAGPDCFPLALHAYLAARPSGHYLVYDRIGVMFTMLALQSPDANEARRLLGHSNEAFHDAWDRAAYPPVTASQLATRRLSVRAMRTINALLLLARFPDDGASAASARSDVLELLIENPDHHDPPAVLYNAACALARASSSVASLSLTTADASALRRHAARFLLHACLRDPAWWLQAVQDPDLEALRPWIHVTAAHFGAVSRRSPQQLHELAERILQDPSAIDLRPAAERAGA